MKKVAPPKVQKFPAAKQRRLDKLLDKNREGTISAKEKGALEQLVAQAEQWMVANARRLATIGRVGSLATIIPRLNRADC